MPGFDPKSEYRWRFIKETPEDQEAAEAKKRKSADDSRNIENIAAAVDCIKQEYQRANDQNAPHKKGERCREWLVIAGLWVAAFVGVGAILYTHFDASEQLIASQRAWIKVTEVAFVDNGALMFSKTEGANLPLFVSVKNTGNAPAIHGRWYLWLVPGPAGKGYDLSADTKRDICNNLRKTKMRERGIAIFPADSYPRDGKTIMASAEASVAAITSMMNRGQAVPNSFDLRVQGCFDYAFPSDPRAHHQTGFSFALARKVPVVIGQLMPLAFTLDMGSTPESGLALVGDLTGPAD